MTAPTEDMSNAGPTRLVESVSVGGRVSGPPEAPTRPAGAQAPPCPGGGFLGTSGRWERQRGCGAPCEVYTPVWLAEASRNAPRGTAVVAPTYTTGLCVDCGRREREARAYLARRAADGEEQESPRGRKGKWR